MAENSRHDEDRLNTPGRRSSISWPRRLRLNEDWFGRLAEWIARRMGSPGSVSYTHLRAHETVLDIVCRLLLEKKKPPYIRSSRRR